MNKRIVLIASSIILLLFGGWYASAYIGFQKDDKEVNKLFANILDAKTVFFNHGQINENISYSNLLYFDKLYKINKRQIKIYEKNIGSGLINAFWLTEKRKNKHDTIIRFLQEQEKFIYSTELVIQDLKDVYEENMLIQESCNDELANTLIIISTKSDSEDYLRSSKNLEKMMVLCEEWQSRLNSIETNSSYSEGTNKLFESVINNIYSRVSETCSNITIQNKVVNLIYYQLNEYKKELIRSISSNYNVVRIMNNIASEYQPIIFIINEEIKPVIEIIEILDKPIIGGRIFGLYKKKKSGISYSSLDLINDIDPTTGYMIETLKVTCQTIQSLENELNEIVHRTNPFIKSVNQYIQINSRNNMKKVINQAKVVNSYYTSRRNTFENITTLLTKTKSDIKKIEALASRLRSSKERKRIYKMTASVRKLVNTVSGPFNQWKIIVDEISKNTDLLQSLESNYLRIISKYNDGRLIKLDDI